MPAPSKKKLYLGESLGKARDSLAKNRKEDHQQALGALNEENRLLRAELEHRKTVEKELRAALHRSENQVQLSSELPSLPRLGTGQTLCDKSKAIVCRVLQFAKAYCGRNAVEWTSSVTGIRAETLRSYEKETDIQLAARSVEAGSLAYKLPPCTSAKRLRPL
ncbi:hypothetical protein L596_009995 [Steinernema carpocapsae]|uniref:Uncharacterized protein n=1 Tax=Steinernema carpocapsae TaxID=34508 RepID=A0A4V6A6T9_STECR|nr:hypothetical protein L596_009995 [Steinernema carpocapsae]